MVKTIVEMDLDLRVKVHASLPRHMILMHGAIYTNAMDIPLKTASLIRRLFRTKRMLQRL
jgi:hypothetical protein